MFYPACCGVEAAVFRALGWRAVFPTSSDHGRAGVSRLSQGWARNPNARKTPASRSSLNDTKTQKKEKKTLSNCRTAPLKAKIGLKWATRCFGRYLFDYASQAGERMYTWAPLLTSKEFRDE